MSPKAIEKISTSIIDGLKGQPVVLALIVFNVIVMVLTYFAVTTAREREERLMTIMLKQQGESMSLLYKCGPSPGG